MLKLHQEMIDNELCIRLHDRMYSIADDARGVREKFWLVRESGRIQYDEPLRTRSILFKFNRNDKSCEDWGEVYASSIARKMGVICVDYYSAALYDDHKNLIGNGVLCGNYKKHNRETEYSGFDIQNMIHNFVYEECASKKIKGLNTVDGFIFAITKLFGDKLSYQQINQIRNSLIKQAIFDFLLAQTDRHWLNTTFLVSEIAGEFNMYKAGCYDNGCIALLKRKLSAIEGMSREIGKLGKDSPYLKNKLDGYCPMFGIKTSTVVIEDRTGKCGLDRLKVVEPQQSREVFLDELAEEILTNPEIAVFFKKLETMQERGIIAEVTNELVAAGDNPPECVSKMIKDVVGHQFDVLSQRVHTRLRDYQQHGEGGM